jgi:hypothetical protein
MATKQIAQALRVIVGWSEDGSTDGASFGFTDKQAHEQEAKTFKDLSPH